MSREIKTEHFFCTRAHAVWFYNEQKHFDPKYNLIRFTFLSEYGYLCYYLVTTSPLMTVIHETSDYLSMLAKYSIDRLGYEPSDRGCFLTAVELIDF